ncbi:GTPase [Serpentinimonas maccroryi]|uniref:GTPase n=1 Tax=Serpentinimonas maccroryi TaxID=1458426 RepID=A0A060NTK2_9BURK|nr:GTPase [Serpentinimonas maccroryi]
MAWRTAAIIGAGKAAAVAGAVGATGAAAVAAGTGRGGVTCACKLPTQSKAASATAVSEYVFMIKPFMGTPTLPAHETYLNKGSQPDLSYARGAS